MAVFCSRDDADQNKGAEGPLGHGVSDDRTGMNDEQTLFDEAERVFQKQKMQDDVRDGIHNTANGNNYSGQRSSATDQARQRMTAKQILDSIRKEAEAGMARSWDIMKEYISAAKGSSVGKATWWTNLKNYLYTNWVNDRGDLLRWMGLHAHDPNNPTFRNTFIRAAEKVAPIARGFQTRFRERQTELLRSILPIANRMGRSLDDTATLMGHWAVAQHIKEANRTLIKRWRAEADAIEDTSPHMEYDPKARRLRYDAQWLEDHLNDIRDEKDEEAMNHKTAGYTDAEAEQVKRKLLDMGFTEKELNDFSEKLRGEFSHILHERARMGVLDPKVLDEFPDWEHYVPLLSRAVNSGNLAGAANDATAYNPGKYHAMTGKLGKPDSAFTSLTYYANRAAMEIGSRDLGNALYALHRTMLTRRRDTGYLRMVDYDKVMEEVPEALSSYENYRRNAYAQIMNHGGLVSTVMDESGHMVKKIFYFENMKWENNGAKFDGSALNKALSADFRFSDPGPVINLLAKSTGMIGSLYTRFTPLFGPVAGIRDIGERMFNMTNRTYTREDGTALPGQAVASRCLGNMARTSETLIGAMMNRLDPNSPMGRYWQEYVDTGNFQKFTQRFYTKEIKPGEAPNLSAMEQAAKRIGLDAPQLRRFMNSLGTNGERALDTLDKWNDYYQNLSAWNHFVTLREMGVSAREAGSDVLEMMNMSQRGKLGPFIQALAPFGVPTAQSGVAQLRTFGLGADNLSQVPKMGMKGYASLLGAYLAYSMLAPLAKSSMGTDENGESVYDSMAFSQLVKGLPIGLGGAENDYVKLPIGFGLPQMGAALAIGVDRIGQGRMTPGEVTSEVLSLCLQNMVAGNWPEYDCHDKPAQWLARIVTPQLLQPIMDVWTNTDFLGRRIHYETYSDVESPAESGRTTTPRVYHQMAQSIKDATGLDLFPEDWQAISKGYFAGPLRLILSAAIQSDDIYRGATRPTVFTEVDPFVAAIGITSVYGMQPTPEESRYYEAKRAIEGDIRQRGIHMADSVYGSDSAKNKEYKRSKMVEGGMPSGAVADYADVIFDADRQLKKLGRDFNAKYKAKMLAGDDSEELKTALRELQENANRIYVRAANALNYWKGGY